MNRVFVGLMLAATVALATAEDLLTVEQGQEQIRVATTNVARWIQDLICEFERNGIGGHDVRGLKEITGTLEELTDSEMQQVIELLKSSRGAEAHTRQEYIARELRRVVEKYRHRQELTKMSSRLSALADRQDANLDRALKESAESSTLAGQIAEQEAIGAEIDHIAASSTNGGQFPDQSKTKMLQSAQADALAALKNSNAGLAVPHEKIIRDELRMLAGDLTVSPQREGTANVGGEHGKLSNGEVVGESAVIGLPERDRQVFQESQIEKYPAKYKSMIEQYYRSLADAPVAGQH